MTLMAKVPIGMFAKAHLDVEALFTEFQAEAMLYLKEQYSMADDSFKLEEATWEQFFRAKEKAQKEGTLDQFEQQLASQLEPLLQSLLQQQAGG